MRQTRAGWILFLSCFICLGANEGPFVGAERCQLCHRVIYNRWKLTVHSRATESLDIGSRRPSCLACHATGPEGLPGVQCEACHGAGTNYWPAEIMIDTEKSRAAGLLTPDEGTCRRCHGQGLFEHADRFVMLRNAELLRAVH